MQKHNLSNEFESYLLKMLNEGVDTHVIRVFRDPASLNGLKLSSAPCPPDNSRAAPIEPPDQITPAVRRIPMKENPKEEAPKAYVSGLSSMG